MWEEIRGELLLLSFLLILRNKVLSVRGGHRKDLFGYPIRQTRSSRRFKSRFVEKCFHDLFDLLNLEESKLIKRELHVERPFTRCEWMVRRFFPTRTSSVEAERRGDICWIRSKENVSSTCNVSLVAFVRFRLIKRTPECEIPIICTWSDWYFGIWRIKREKWGLQSAGVNVRKQGKVDRSMSAIAVLALWSFFSSIIDWWNRPLPARPRRTTLKAAVVILSLPLDRTNLAKISSWFVQIH